MKMATKLMWVFVLVAMVPAASLSAVYAYYAKQLADGITALHYIAVEEAGTRGQLHDHLVAIEQNLSAFIHTRDSAKRALIADDIREHGTSFIDTVNSYQDSKYEKYENTLTPGETENERAVLDSINEKWRDYSSNLDAILAAQGRDDFVAMATAIASDSEQLLDAMHKQIDELASTSISTSAALMEKSQNDYAMSQLFGTLASGSAAATALFVSVGISKKYHLSFEERKKSVKA